MGHLSTIFRRELMGYFATPLAYIFVVIFLITNGIFTFDLGGFYIRGQADLLPFFGFHPWLYLFMVPAKNQEWQENQFPQIVPPSWLAQYR